jgi:hypothetical protein
MDPFLSSGTLLGLLETADLNHCSRVGAFLPSREDGNRSIFRNVVLSSYLEFQMMDKGQCYTP